MTVYRAGTKNDHAGPDFSQARVKIGSFEWIGNVEMHVLSSNWMDHHHDADPAYDNVILHVVWNHNHEVKRRDGTVIPTLELSSRIDKKLLLRYQVMINQPGGIVCDAVIHRVPKVYLQSMLEGVIMSRLENKSREVKVLLDRLKNNWEEVCYQLLCKNFGFKVNEEPFLKLSATLPHAMILKQSDQLIQIEALLFGQAGFLNSAGGDAYQQSLAREYQFLRRKFSLSETPCILPQWRFLRLRPANFPTLRLAQLAAVCQHNKTIFSRLLEVEKLQEVKEMFVVAPSAYWNDHYRFSKTTKRHTGQLGEFAIDNIIINTVIPLMVTFGEVQGEDRYLNRCLNWLQKMNGENNNITRKWQALGIENRTAFESQSLLELYHSYCLRKRCLECHVGSYILRPDPA